MPALIKPVAKRELFTLTKGLRTRKGCERRIDKAVALLPDDFGTVAYVIASKEDGTLFPVVKLRDAQVIYSTHFIEHGCAVVL